MGSAIFRCACSGIPRPLVHGDEVDVRLVLHESLSAVSVVYIPIDDQNSLEPVFLARVMRRQRDISKKAESHCPVVNRVMPGWSHRREAARMDGTHGEIDG